MSRRAMGIVLFGLALTAAAAVGGSAVPVGADGNEAPGAPLAARSISTGGSHTCALVAGGVVRCWGANGNGRLGLGDTVARLGRSTTNPSLGSGRTATAISAGSNFTCALLDDGSVKCWGANASGQLGQGDTADRGDAPGELGDALPPIALGTGRTATAISAGSTHACAVLDNGAVKCWGANGSGRLGLGDTANRGDGPGEMGDALAAVDLGTGRTASAVAAGAAHTCAVLDNGAVKCWGSNGSGRLGLGDTANRGDGPGELGDSLPAVALGSGRTATAISAGGDFTCAVLDDATLKCWGENGFAALGSETSNDTGDGPGEMGDALNPLQLGTGRTATGVSAGSQHACARLDDATVKCWGAAISGQLGFPSVQVQGDHPGEMGDGLAPIPLGAGRSVLAVTAGPSVSCAVLDDGAVKCWGANDSGALGLGDTSDRGDDAGEMGDQLLHAGASVNNAFRNAQALTVPGTGTTDAVTEYDDTEPGEPDHAGDPGGRSVWYRFTAASTGTATIDTFGSAIDTVLAVYTGTTIGALTPVAAADDTGGPQSEVEVELEQGLTYQVAVDGAAGAGGSVQVHEAVVFDPLAPSVVTPAAGATFDQYEVVGSDYACAVVAGSSPLASCAGPVADGQPVDTSTPGPHTFTVTATDQAGNSRTTTRAYTVVAAPTLTAAITSTPTRVIAGDDIDYVVTVTNTGPHPLTSVTVHAPDVSDCAGPVADIAPAASRVVECTYTTTEDDVPQMTNQVLVTTAQGAFGLSGTRRTRVDPTRTQPDGAIALGAGPAVGGDIHNTTAAQQSRATTVANRGTATFRIRVQNDGNRTDSYTLRGLGTTERFWVTYRDGPNDVTAGVRSGVFTVSDLPPGASHDLTLVVRARAGAPAGSRVVRSLTITSAADGSRDVVRATVTRR